MWILVHEFSDDLGVSVIAPPFMRLIWISAACKDN